MSRKKEHPKKQKMKVLYSDDDLCLQEIYITIGNISITKWREIRTANRELDVREYKSIPEWYLRWEKLKKIGI
jgi:hypothetical protein